MSNHKINPYIYRPIPHLKTEITKRLKDQKLPSKEMAKLRINLDKVLMYLYTSETNRCSKYSIRMSEAYLTPFEIYLSNWMCNKTDDSQGKKHYGINAIKVSKDANFCCTRCGENDIRTLHIDHIDQNRDNIEQSNFQLLCANCHSKKTSEERYRERFQNDKQQLSALNLHAEWNWHANS